ncbi:MAG: hypothetical protein FWG88_00620 [Oscillospiraceae bacterium]|nr:hypothetical protein [Oscillospiraceae bacterium]
MLRIFGETFITDLANSGDAFFGLLMSKLGYSIILLIAVMQCGKWAKALLNVM